MRNMSVLSQTICSSPVKTWKMSLDSVMSFCFPECISRPVLSSLAGEFFPEAAQIAYKMWEQSAMTKVQVWSGLFLTLHVWLHSLACI